MRKVKNVGAIIDHPQGRENEKFQSIKGSLGEGAPDGVGWGRARYNKESINLMLRRLLPSPNGATFLPEEGKLGCNAAVKNNKT